MYTYPVTKRRRYGMALQFLSLKRSRNVAHMYAANKPSMRIERVPTDW
jgi:hypothetical protein